MLRKLARLLRDERGITTVEILVATGILAVIALVAYSAIRPYTANSAGTIGGKLQNAVASNNPSW